jgi:hypothetical protein
MGTESNFKMKIILNQAQELLDCQGQFFSNTNFLATFHSEWIDVLSRITHFWVIANAEQKALIQKKYEEVKPIALKLKLPWPEELSK